MKLTWTCIAALLLVVACVQSATFSNDDTSLEGQSPAFDFSLLSLPQNSPLDFKDFMAQLNRYKSNIKKRKDARAERRKQRKIKLAKDDKRKKRDANIKLLNLKIQKAEGVISTSEKSLKTQNANIKAEQGKIAKAKAELIKLKKEVKDLGGKLTAERTAKGKADQAVTTAEGKATAAAAKVKNAKAKAMASLKKIKELNDKAAEYRQEADKKVDDMKASKAAELKGEQTDAKAMAEVQVAMKLQAAAIADMKAEETAKDALKKAKDKAKAIGLKIKKFENDIKAANGKIAVENKAETNAKKNLAKAEGIKKKNEDDIKKEKKVVSDSKAEIKKLKAQKI